jgi:enoyl-[acyl-carrier protein] reductase II
MGTRFIASKEARGHDNYKNRLVEATDEDTVVSRGHSGKTVRMLRNKFTDYWAANEARILPYPHQLQEVGTAATVLGRIEGDIENGVLPAGQIVEDIVAEAREAFRRFEATA